jgi:hypothetical protein
VTNTATTTNSTTDETGVREFAVQTIYGEAVRLTCWDITASHSETAGGSVWLHTYDDPAEPSCHPSDGDSEFFGAIALDAEAALRLGTALVLAAKTMLAGR